MVTTGNMFYVLDGPNATITFVDINGSVVVVPNATPIVVSGNKATNETRFDLTACPAGTKWEEYLNGLLFAVTNKNALQRQQRGYKPEFLLASEVTSNYMTQAKAYEAMGQRKSFQTPTAVGEGNYGFTGGLPHFGSDVFDDAYILLSQKDATIFRIFEPLVLKGPYPVRSTTGQLIGGDEYYIYQEDSLSSPINEKMSLVTVLS
jgi:ribosomal protein L13